jgi:hypothetical protein
MTLFISDDRLEQIPLSATARAQALANAKEGYVMTLLQLGEITSGRAGKLLGISHLEVIEKMKRWGISLFDDSLDTVTLATEIEQASKRLPQRLL